MQTEELQTENTTSTLTLTFFRQQIIQSVVDVCTHTRIVPRVYLPEGTRVSIYTYQAYYMVN